MSSLTAPSPIPEAATVALHARRRAILARYRSSLERADEELESREIELTDNANELWDAQLLSLLSDADAHLLVDIVAALRRIEDGRYGACLDCGEPIAPDRLEVLPEAARCILCASAREA